MPGIAGGAGRSGGVAGGGLGAGRSGRAPTAALPTAAVVPLVAVLAAVALVVGAEPGWRRPGSVARTARLSVVDGRLVPPPGHTADGPGGGPGAGSAVADALLRDEPPRRITLVLLGDGYTADRMWLFREQAERARRALMRIEPFRTYQHFFDVRRVEIVSPASGISDERRPRRQPVTPLRMHFWCGGTARLLCVDERAAAHYAGRVRGPRYLIAIADSNSYGGAGGTGVTTLAGGSPEAGRIIQHEMGHTVGNLGDEYDSAPPDADFPNLSAVGAAAMRAGRLKWWRWLGTRLPDGQVVGAYRGGNGLFRPTPDSVMRTLGGEYNPPSREAVIRAVYRQVGPLDAVLPPAGPVRGRPRLWVRPVPLEGGRQLEVRWRLDGHPFRPGAGDGTWCDTAGLLPARGRRAIVTATVRDTTRWVRDEAFRARWMTRTVTWTLSG
jgi:hypothetical protein